MKSTTVSYQSNLPTSTAPSTGLIPDRFQKLPLGEVTLKQGWLRRQLDLMCGGITGRLPEYGPFFKPEKNGYLYPETAAGWEEIPYWFRGFYPMAVLAESEKHLAIAKEYFEALFASVQEDGWFGPAYLKSYEIIDGIPAPDLFPSMMLLDTLILYYENTKDPRVIDLMDGFFAFCRRIPDCVFLPESKGRLRWQKIRGGDMLTPIHWYYRFSGKEWLLELAERFYQKIWKASFPFVAHHAVDFGQRVGYDAVYSRQSGDPKDFAASEKAYLDFQEAWGQTPRGIFCADEQVRAGCTDPRQGYEPCGMVELAKNFYEMGRISGDTLYGDRAEDVILNHFIPSFSPDYQQMHYLTSSNLPILSDWREQPSCNGSWVRSRSHEIFTPNNRCCGHNTGMGLPWYAMNLWQASNDGGLVAWLYADSEVQTTIHGKKVALRMRTGYPFHGTIQITCDANEGGAFPIYFRIPSFAKQATLTVKEQATAFADCYGGYLRVEADWQAGDQITLSLPMELTMTRWKTNGSVSVDRGPLTYSIKIGEEWRRLEEAGQYNHPTPHLFENYEVYPTNDWNYGLCLTEENIHSCVSVQTVASEIADMPWTLENAPVVLRARVKKIPQWTLEDDMAAELQPSPAYTECEEESVEMIPLGCARLRISCLPVVSEDPENAVHWKPSPTHTDLITRPKRYPDPYHFEESKAVNPQ